MKYWTVAVVAVLCCSNAWAGEFKGNGYSLTVPDDWTQTTKDAKRTLEDTVRSKTRTGPGMDAVLFAPDKITNANVVIAEGRPRISQSGLSEARQAIIDSLTSSGIKTNVLDCQIINSNGRDFILFKADDSHAAFPGQMRQWALVGAGGDKVYTFTFTTMSKDASKWEPTFDRIVHSVKIESGAMDWFNELPAVLRWGMIGGMIGGMVGVIRMMIKKKPTQQSPPFVSPPAVPPLQ